MSADGVLVVDKPPGFTSHDVVARARRALGTRAVGHAGTLDPMATGVLVLAVGEGTKLVAYLTGQDKEYEAVIALGTETDSLDADGKVCTVAPVPEGIDLGTVTRAAASFSGRIEQEAPAVSAIKVGGERLHAKVRRGKDVKPPVREVEVREIEILEVLPGRIRLRVACGKGFYVRALARDLSRALGTVGHLVALRRTRSGPFTIADAVPYARLDAAARGDDEARAGLRLMGLLEAWGEGPVAVLDDRGAEDARHGRPIDVRVETDEVVALVHDGRMIGLGRQDGDRLRVVRGIKR